MNPPFNYRCAHTIRKARRSIVAENITKMVIMTVASVVLTLSGCAPAPPPQAVVTPQPSATLERAPTRPRDVSSTSQPAGSAALQSQSPLKPATLIGTPVPPPRLGGQFVFSPGDGSVWIQDAATGRLRTLVKPTADLFAEAPEFSPDGKRVAFMESKLSPNGAAQNSIHLVDSDGQHDRALALPPDAKTTLGYPVFSPDGNWVYYTASFPVPPSGEHFEIQRMASSGGPSQAVLQDAQSAVFSADGSHLVFTRFNFTNFSASLWVADAIGQNAKLMVADDLFSAIAASRFSPDGKWILFTASGPPTRSLPGALLMPHRSCEPQLLCALAGTAYADGLPWDLWLVSVDGKHFEQLTNVGFDSPWPAWSGDSKYIGIFETSGFYVLDMDKHLLSRWKAEGGHGVMDWWTPNP
jgi:Tol biopolymer transport system component